MGRPESVGELGDDGQIPRCPAAIQAVDQLGTHEDAHRNRRPLQKLGECRELGLCRVVHFGDPVRQQRLLAVDREQPTDRHLAGDAAASETLDERGQLPERRAAVAVAELDRQRIEPGIFEPQTAQELGGRLRRNGDDERPVRVAGESNRRNRDGRRCGARKLPPGDGCDRVTGRDRRIGGDDDDCVRRDVAGGIDDDLYGLVEFDGQRHADEAKTDARRLCAGALRGARGDEGRHRR